MFTLGPRADTAWENIAIVVYKKKETDKRDNQNRGTFNDDANEYFLPSPLDEQFSLAKEFKSV